MRSDRKVMIRDVLVLHRDLKSEMLADYGDNTAGEFADGPAGQKIDEARVEGGNENSYRRMLVGEAQLPFHGVGLGKWPERRGNFFSRDRKLIDFPFDP